MPCSRQRKMSQVIQPLSPSLKGMYGKQHGRFLMAKRSQPLYNWPGAYYNPCTEEIILN